MSFSSDIKQILCTTEYECPYCMASELAGFFGFSGKLLQSSIRVSVPQLAERVLRLIQNETGDTPTCKDNRISVGVKTAKKIERAINNTNINKRCCKSSFLRGAFLGSGSVSNPEKEYHLEFATKLKHETDRLSAMLNEMGFNPKITQRRDKVVVYIKESAQIADILGHMSCGRAGLEVLSVQVEKEIKSSTQRRVNCDSANLNKQATASARHIAAIRKIKKARKWSSMPDVLREIGELRLKYPDVSLEELGRLTEQGIGKSGVNHRLNRILEYAEGVKTN